MPSATEYDAPSSLVRHWRHLAPQLTPRSPLFYIFCLPAVLATIGILVPFLFMIYYTFTNKQLSPMPYTFVGFANYTLTLQDSEFWHALSVTLLYAAEACVIEIPLGTLVAWGLSHDFFGARTLRVLVVIPMMISPVIGALMWKMMLNPTTGVLTFFLDKVGVHNFAGFADPTTALPTIVVVDVWLFTPFVILILLAAMRNVPHELFEAASLDGASTWRIFWHVVLPLITPFIVLVSLFRAIDCLKMFDTIYATTGGGPVVATMNFTLEAYIRTFQWHQVGASLVYVALLWVIVFVVSQVLIYRWGQSLSTR